MIEFVTEGPVIAMISSKSNKGTAAYMTASNTNTVWDNIELVPRIKHMLAKDGIVAPVFYLVEGKFDSAVYKGCLNTLIVNSTNKLSESVRLMEALPHRKLEKSGFLKSVTQLLRLQSDKVNNERRLERKLCSQERSIQMPRAKRVDKVSTEMTSCLSV